jgi:hypothetical protein
MTENDRKKLINLMEVLEQLAEQLEEAEFDDKKPASLAFSTIKCLNHSINSYANGEIEPIRNMTESMLMFLDELIKIEDGKEKFDSLLKGVNIN